MPVVVIPSITTQPVNATVTGGATATFTVVTSGTPAPKYQWQFIANGGSSWTNISGATSVNYITPTATSTLNGYMYRCVVTNPAGTVTSSPAILTVNAVKGNIDGIINNRVGGWACVTNSPNYINVALYAGAPGSNGVLIGTYLANTQSEPAVASSCNSTGSTYRYSIPISPSIREQFGGQMVYIVGLSPGNGADALLNNSGKYFIPVRTTTIWFCPRNQPPIPAPDYMNLFQQPNTQWPNAASHVQVFVLLYPVYRSCIRRPA